MIISALIALQLQASDLPLDGVDAKDDAIRFLVQASDLPLDGVDAKDDAIRFLFQFIQQGSNCCIFERDILDILQCLSKATPKRSEIPPAYLEQESVQEYMDMIDRLTLHIAKYYDLIWESMRSTNGAHEIYHAVCESLNVQSKELGRQSEELRRTKPAEIFADNLEGFLQRLQEQTEAYEISQVNQQAMHHEAQKRCEESDLFLSASVAMIDKLTLHIDQYHDGVRKVMRSGEGFIAIYHTVRASRQVQSYVVNFQEFKRLSVQASESLNIQSEEIRRTNHDIFSSNGEGLLQRLQAQTEACERFQMWMAQTEEYERLQMYPDFSRAERLQRLQAHAEDCQREHETFQQERRARCYRNYDAAFGEGYKVCTDLRIDFLQSLKFDFPNFLKQEKDFNQSELGQSLQKLLIESTFYRESESPARCAIL